MRHILSVSDSTRKLLIIVHIKKTKGPEVKNLLIDTIVLYKLYITGNRIGPGSFRYINNQIYCTNVFGFKHCII